MKIGVLKSDSSRQRPCSPRFAGEAGRSSEKGIVLVAVVVFTLIFTLLGFSLLSMANSEIVMARKDINKTKAFYLAEGGLGMAISDLPNTNSLSGTLGDGEYDVTITPVSGFSNRWTIESVGSVNMATRRIRAVVVVRPDVTTAMMISGGLVVKGNDADVNGVVGEYTTPCFEDIFGVTKEEMQDNATYKYTSPPNNQTPVEKITWVNEDNEFKITTTDWVGSGIMIVNGDLDISGGTFNGVIWVIGELFISGNTVINGSIFVEGGATVDTTITGTAEISFEQLAIGDAFSNLSTVLSWQEF